MKIVRKYIRDNGVVINDMETGNKSTRTSVIDIKVSSSTINIMVEEYYKMKTTHIQEILSKVYSMETE